MRKTMPIFYSALMLTGVNLLLRFASTAFQVYLSGRIGAAGIGLLQLVLSVGTMAMTAGIAGIRTATMYLTAEELGKGRAQNVGCVLSGCIRYSILCSGAVALGLFAFSEDIAALWLGDAATAGALRLLAALLPASCLCGVMSGYFTAAKRIGTLSIVGICEQLFSIAVTIALLQLWAKSDPYRACKCVILGGGAGSLLTLSILTFLQLRQHIPFEARIPVARRLLHTAVPLALADDLKSGISTAENLMVPKRLALYRDCPDPLAQFGTVCGMVFPVLMFPACILFSLAELLIPELARCAAAGSHVRVRYLVKRSLKVAMVYGFAMGGLLFLLASALCLRLYGSPDAGRELARFSLLAPMLYCDAITDAINKGLGQQKISVRYNILTAAMDVTFLFLLLPRYGMGGYFFSFLVTHAVNFLLSLRLLSKTAGVSLSAFPMLGTAGAAAAAVFLCLRLPPVVAAASFCAVFVSLLVLLGVLKKEDALWLSGLVQKNPR